MAEPIGKAVLDVGFDPRQVEQAGQQQLLPSAKRIAGDVAATFAAVKVIDFGRQGLDELKEAEKQSSNVTAVIKATGGAANVTAAQIDELASSQLKLTGVDDEIIKGGAAKLLTFRNVRDEVGKGNDVFTRATKAGLDLAQVGFGTPETAAILLGKALNDPIKGITALQRAGVTFTESQKNTIKSLVETGDLLGAQKIILDEVEHQVGGAAAAYGQTLPGKIDIAEQSVENMKGSLVAAEAPFIELGANGVEFLSDKLEDLPPAAQTAVGGVIATAAGVGLALGPVRDAAQILDILSARRAAKIATDATEVAGNTAVAASEVEVTAARAGSAVAIEAEGVAALNSAASVEALYAAETTALAPLAALVAGFAAFVAVGYGVGEVIDGLTNSSAFDKIGEDFDAVDKSLATLDDDLSNFNARTFNDKLNELVRGNDDFATALQHAGVTTGDFVFALTAGGESFDSFIDKAIHAKGVTEEDQVALSALATQANAWAQNAANAAVATGQLDQATLDATTGQHLFSDGTVDFIAVLEDLSAKGLISKTVVEGVKSAAEEEINTEQQQKLAAAMKDIEENANRASDAALQLAPADIRVQRGRINIEEDRLKVADAEKKLSNLRKIGTPDQIAQAERDLQTARLDLEQATLDQAGAEVELQKQQDAANGVQQDALYYAELYNQKLQGLAGTLNGPVRDALATYIFNQEIANQKAAFIAEGSPYFETVGPRPSSGRPGPRAAGGSVMSMFEGAEYGPELLLSHGLYQSPPGGGTVVNAHDTADLFAGANREGLTIGEVNVYGENPMAAIRRLPDELRIERHLAGV